MFENIDRIRMPSVGAFVMDYLRPRKPVILTDLFPLSATRELKTLPKALLRLGGRKIEIQDEYMATVKKQLKEMVAGAALKLRKEQISIQDYMKAFSGAGENQMCIEQPVSPDLDGVLPVPALCREDLEGRLFVGKAGNVAHLHFDSDQRHVIQLHLFGSKRIILFPPQANAQLSPFRNFSSWHMDHLSEEARDEMVRKLGGYQCRLLAGESLFMPALTWHYLHYEEAGISLSLRFGRNEFNKFLGTHCHASQQLQPLAWNLIDETRIDPSHLEAYREIVEALKIPAPSPFEKGKAMEELFRRINRDLFPEIACSARIIWFDELGITDMMREWEINTKALYRTQNSEPLKKAA